MKRSVKLYINDIIEYMERAMSISRRWTSTNSRETTKLVMRL